MITSTTAQDSITTFFGQYEKRFNDALAGRDPDIEEAAAAFANHFLEASPNGLISGANDDNFRIAIPQGYAFYKKIGTTSMKIAGIEITHLDEHHAMARVDWHSRYKKKNSAEEVIIDFTVIYLLQLQADHQWKIFAYITGDEQKVLQDHGLVDALSVGVGGNQ